MTVGMRGGTFRSFAKDRSVQDHRLQRDTARRVARGLQARGLRKGDFVVIHLDNCPEFLLAWCGCALAGVVAVTTNTGSAAAELSYYIEKSGARAAIAARGRAAAGPRAHRAALGTAGACRARPQIRAGGQP